MSHTPKPFDKNKYGWPEKQERDLSSRVQIGVAPIMRDSDGTGLVSKETVQKRIKRREAAKDKVKNTSPSEVAEAAKDKVKNTSPSEVAEAAKDKVKNTSVSEGAEAAKDKVKNTSPSEVAEAANKYKGIVQLGVLAVGIAGTVGAYVWRNN